MDIVYIWIKNYKDIIIEEGINFGAENLYGYENNILYKKKNQNYYKNFFGKSIINITGVIGKNGTGKSTILNFVKENLANNLKNIKEEAIIILRINDEDVIYRHTNINIENAKDFNTKVYYHIENEENNNLKEEVNTKIIYLSNIFDTNYSDYSSNILDISTNHLVRFDKYNNNQKYENNSIGQVQAYEISELHRQILFNFKYSKKEKFIDFIIPRTIEVYPIELEYFNDLRDDDTLIYAKDKRRLAIIENFNKNMDNIMKSDNEVKKFKIKIIRILLENIIHVSRKYYKEHREEITNYIIDELDKINKSDEGVVEEFKHFFNNLEGFVKKMHFDSSNLESKIKGSKNLYNFILYRKKEEFFYGNLILDEKDKIIKILDIYYTVVDDLRLLSFKWRNLSSGQSALLNLFSRLYYYNDIDEDNIILLIDEGEIYFHPQWQKKLINYLVEFLPSIYNSDKHSKTIQLIITSNSPFLISDLPKTNVIFLKCDKYDNKCRVLNDSEMKSQTFASNIHTLFSNSFFIEGSLIGDFANQKIKSVAKDLSEKTPDKILKEKGRKEEIEYIIKNIGEPLIKKKLQQMYNSRFKIDDTYYKLQISRLENEKAILEQSLEKAGLGEIDAIMKLLDMKIKELKQKVDDKGDTTKM